MKKLLEFDWLRAVQFKCNTVQFKCNTVQKSVTQCKKSVTQCKLQTNYYYIIILL
jgi:hypothetical protein